MSKYTGVETDPMPREPVSLSLTRRSGSLYGRDCNSTARTTEKIAVFAPIPSAKQRIAMTVGVRAPRNERSANRMSCRSVSIARVQCLRDTGFDSDSFHSVRTGAVNWGQTPILRQIEASFWASPPRKRAVYSIGATGRAVTRTIGSKDRFREDTPMGIRVFVSCAAILVAGTTSRLTP